jgi:hypothetical protein
VNSSISRQPVAYGPYAAGIVGSFASARCSSLTISTFSAAATALAISAGVSKKSRSSTRTWNALPQTSRSSRRSVSRGAILRVPSGATLTSPFSRKRTPGTLLVTCSGDVSCRKWKAVASGTVLRPEILRRLAITSRVSWSANVRWYAVALSETPNGTTRT